MVLTIIKIVIIIAVMVKVILINIIILMIRLILNVLVVLLISSDILFHNAGPMRGKTLWPVLDSMKGCLNFGRCFKMISYILVVS